MEDPWLEEGSGLDPLQLHALGAVSAHWNVLEYSIFTLFSIVSRTTPDQARALVHDLKVPSIMARIVNFADKPGWEHPRLSEDFVVALKHADKHIDYCRQNRNLLMHSIPAELDNEVKLLRLKGPIYKFDNFPCDVWSIRQVAEDIIATTERVGNLISYATAIKFDEEPPELPEESTLPARLWSPPNPQKKPTQI